MDDVVSSELPLTAIADEKSPEQQAIETEQINEERQLALLSEHPGWQQIRTQMVGDIERIRKFEGIDMKQYTNAELGEVIRTELSLANKLEAYVLKVDNAVKAVVEANGQQRNE